MPIDLVTTSGSGLDPAHLAGGGLVPGAARRQGARHCRRTRSAQLVDEHVEGRLLGILGEPRVNVLALNLALDELRDARMMAARGLLVRGAIMLEGIDARRQRRDPTSGPRRRRCSRRPGARKPRGRLKIFLGAAPGVGKTYEMLQTAPRAKDATASTSSSASSRRTAARRPRRCSRASRSSRAAASTTRASTLEEMDLDAILARRPQLVLVDELAHTNAPGSRHPKRYLDVEELLDAGIDVYTTLNIQHLESLNDVVAQITRIRVRETVPDSILDRADDIEVIDLTPDDLIQRLKEGKVYVPETAERALEHYFSPGNLTALRELALRRTASASTSRCSTHMQAHAIPGPWAAGERVLVCVNEDPRAARRSSATPSAWPTAARAVDGALRRDARAALRLSEAERDRIADTLRLAERLGGEAVTIPGGAQHRRRHRRATRRPTTSPRSSSASRSARAGSRSCTARSCTTSSAAPATSASMSSPATSARRAGPDEDGATRPTPAAAFDSAPYLRAHRLSSRSRSASASLLAAVARRRERRSRLPDGGRRARRALRAVAVALSPASSASLRYNFFFLPPLYTFTIADPENVVALRSSSWSWRSSPAI